MNPSLRIHMLNKWPGGRVQESDSSFDVFSEDGEHVVAMVKNGAGQWIDKSEEYGLVGRHDLSPIPRDARVHKMVNGKVSLDEMHEERHQKRERFRGEHGQILSCEELQKSHGWEFDRGNQSVRREGRNPSHAASEEKA